MKDKLTASEKKVLSYWALAALVLLIVALVFGLITIGRKIIEDKDLIKEYEAVTDKNRYATVSTALSKYYAFISSNNKSAIVTILSNNYKNKNNIDESNVDNYIHFDEKLTYNARAMCYKNLSKNQMTYLVVGFESNKFTGERLDKKYYQVILDSDNFHFSVTPISKKDFKGECYE